MLADNGVFNQPYVFANASIKIVGAALKNGLKGNLNQNDQRQLEQLIDAANAQGLLEFGLRIQQANP